MKDIVILFVLYYLRAIKSFVFIICRAVPEIWEDSSYKNATIQ